MRKFFLHGQNKRDCVETQPSAPTEKSPHTVCKLLYNLSTNFELPLSSLVEKCPGGGHVCSSPLCGFCSANQTTCLKDSGIQELSASSSHSTYSRSSLWQTIQCVGRGGGLKTLSIHNTVQRSLPSLPNLHSPLPPPLTPHMPSLSLLTTAECFLSICILQSGSE